MTTPLNKVLKRQLTVKGREFIVTLSPEAFKITLKGRRNGLELQWEDLISGDAALSVALNASVGRFPSEPKPTRVRKTTPRKLK